MSEIDLPYGFVAKTADDFIRLFDTANNSIDHFSKEEGRPRVAKLRADLGDVDAFKEHVLMSVVRHGPVVIPQIDPTYEDEDHPQWLLIFTPDEVDNFNEQWSEIERKLRERAGKNDDGADRG